MKFSLSILALFVLSTAFANSEKMVKRTPASTTYKVHRCEKDALDRGLKFLKFYAEPDDSMMPSVADSVTLKSSIKSPNGKMKYDVLEVDGYIYKGQYRMRFIYAPLKGECVVMGQEILDLSSL